MEKLTEFIIFKGSKNEALESIEKSLQIFIGKYRSIKIGITGREPQERFNEHLKIIKWERMIVKYQSSSPKILNEMECFFIKKYPSLKNEWIGNSKLKEEGPNYLYFLLKNKIKR